MGADACSASHVVQGGLYLGTSKNRYERMERKEPRSESPRHIK